MPPMEFRQARNSDAPDLIELVATCFRPYRRCILDVPGEEPVLAAPADLLERCWVAEEPSGRVRAMVAAADHPAAAADGGLQVELKKLYVWPGWRRRGVASALAGLVEAHARDRGASELNLWSDTRFLAAHSLYLHLGYAQTGATRLLHDRSETAEYEFRKALPDIGDR